MVRPPMPSAAQSDVDLDASPESRPTLPPPVDIEALAERTRRTTPQGEFTPLEVPTIPPPDEVDDAARLAPLDATTLAGSAIAFDEASVLGHLDGASTVAEVAELLGRPVTEVRGILRGLAERGLVQVALPTPVPSRVGWVSPSPPPAETTSTRRKILPDR